MIRAAGQGVPQGRQAKPLSQLLHPHRTIAAAAPPMGRAREGGITTERIGVAPIAEAVAEHDQTDHGRLLTAVAQDKVI
jgi:hypothetical protein